MGLINFQYIFFVVITGAFFVGGAIDYISRGEYMLAAVTVGMVPAAYLIAAITPWVRGTTARKIIATPVFAVGLLFAVAFTFEHLGLL